MNNIHQIVPKYSKDQVEAFSEEADFMDAGVELLKQTIELIFFVVQDQYYDEENEPAKINRNDAVIAGNLIRVTKLSTSFLENICNHKLEICYILNRCIAETYINLRYLLEEGKENGQRNFIKKSLLQEKELWESILENIDKRSGERLPIEERMQNSIKNSFEDSDFELEEVKRSHKWKSIKNRASVIGNDQFYSIFYGMSSHAIHGNWQDILMNNLDRFEDGFKINLEWRMPRPQILEGPIGLNLSLLKSLSKNLHGIEPTFSREMNDKVEELKQYKALLTNHHEKWILEIKGL